MLAWGCDFLLVDCDVFLVVGVLAELGGVSAMGFWMGDKVDFDFGGFVRLLAEVFVSVSSS